MIVFVLFFYHGFLTILKQSWRNISVIMVSRLKNIRYNFPEYQLHTYHYYLAFAFCHKQKSLHSRIKTPHFRSRATYLFIFFLVTIKCGTRQRQPVIKELMSLDWNNIKYVLFTHDWDVLRSSFAQRISSKGQSYFHNPLFTLWISVDVIGCCSLLNQNLALFCYEYSILIKTNLFIQML